MKFENFVRRNYVSALLAFALLLSIEPLEIYAQTIEEEDLFNKELEQKANKEFEQTAQVIVMLSGDDFAGAGIIFGYEKDRLLIATASHVVQSGNKQPKFISVRFRTMPDTFKATLLKHVNAGGLDLAVLSVDNLSKQRINPCAFPFARLSRIYDLKRGDEVIPVGNPNGNSWVLPVEPDKIAEVNESTIVFQSTYISNGHSGGGLIDKRGNIVGMITEDAPPFGRAIPMNAIFQQLKQWGYPVLLRPVHLNELSTLHKAAEKGDLNEIRNLLAQCYDPNVVDAGFNTPLHYTANHGKVEAMSILLKAGASPDVPNYYGVRPLHVAVIQNEFESVKFLIKSGAKVNRKDRGHYEAIHMAALYCKNIEIIKTLREAGANINEKAWEYCTPLHYAVNALKFGNSVTSGLGSTPNNVSNVETVKAFLKLGADVHARTVDGSTPLHYTLLDSFNIPIIKVLLEAGAKVNAKTEKGNTPLHIAVTRKNMVRQDQADNLEEAIIILLKAGADPSIENNKGETVLAAAKNWRGYPLRRGDPPPRFSADELDAIEKLLNQYKSK